MVSSFQDFRIDLVTKVQKGDEAIQIRIQRFGQIRMPVIRNRHHPWRTKNLTGSRGCFTGTNLLVSRRSHSASTGLWRLLVSFSKRSARWVPLSQRPNIHAFTFRRDYLQFVFSLLQSKKFVTEQINRVLGSDESLPDHLLIISANDPQGSLLANRLQETQLKVLPVLSTAEIRLTLTYLVNKIQKL